GLEPRTGIAYRRIGIADRAGRADCRTAAAAGAKMRLHLDGIALARNGPGRTDVHAIAAAGLLRAAVRADPFVEHEELGFVELAHPVRDSRGRPPLRDGVSAGCEVALGLMRNLDERRSIEIEHQIEIRRTNGRRTIEVDGPHRAAGFDAFAVARAFVQIDLVAVVDGLLGTGGDTRVAARTEIEVDGIARLPLQLERAQIAGQAPHFTGPDGIAARDRQLRTLRIGEQHAYIELVGELLGPRQRSDSRTDNQRATGGLISDIGNRLGGRQLRRGKERGDFRSGLFAFDRPPGA